MAGTIKDEALKLQKNIEAVYNDGHPAFEKTGGLVRCYPVANRPFNVTGIGTMNLIQTGTGDPSPDNIRPITGRDSVVLSCTGKNLYNFRGDPSLIVGMRNNDGSLMDSSKYWGFTIRNLPAGAYTIKPHPINGKKNAYLFGKINNANDEWVQNVNLISQADLYTHTFTLNDGDVIYIYYGVAGSAKDKAVNLFQNVYNVQLEVGSTATAYEPYRGTSVTIPFGETVYGGTYDVNTGLLTADTVYKQFDGTEHWDVYAASGMNSYYYHRLTSVKGTYVASEIVCSHYITNPVSGSNTNCACHITNSSSGDDRIIIRPGNMVDAPSPIVMLDVADWKAYLAEQAANGTPVQVCYKLQKPRTIQLPPQTILPTTGMNQVFTSAGEITVSGNTDPASVIARLEELESAT